MVSKPLALAVLGVGCVVAAAGGGYLALRQTGTATPAQAAQATEAAAPAAAGAPSSVQQPSPTTGLDATVPITETPARPGITREPRRPARSSRQAAGGPIARAETPARQTAPFSPDSEASMPASAPPPATTVEPKAAERQESQVRFDQLTVPSETVIGAQVDTTVTSERARVEDRVEGHVMRDVSVGNRVALPAGTRLLGSVTLVERGGKFHDRARIAVRFHTAMLHDGSRVPIQTTAIVREGDSPTRESAAKVGGAAVGGAILGAILGGGKGAVIGGTAGAAGGGAVVMAGDRNAATLPAGSAVTVRLMSDLTLTVER